MGDVKLAAPVGLYLGYLGWSQLLYGGLLGFVLNGILSPFVLCARNRAERASEVAHGPSMLAAAAGHRALLCSSPRPTHWPTSADLDGRGVDPSSQSCEVAISI